MLLFELRTVLFILLLFIFTSLFIGYYIARWVEGRQRQTFITETFQQLFEHAPIGLLWVQRGQRYEYANNLARWLLTLPEVRGCLPQVPWTDLLDEDVRLLGTQAVHGGQQRTFSLKDKSEQSYTLRWHLMHWNNSTVVLVQDLTQQQQMATETRRLISDLSHELRTPLATIQTHVEILRLEKISEAVRAQSLQFLKDETQQATELINRMLALGRIEAGFIGEFYALALLPVVESALIQLDLEAQKMGVLLTIQASELLPAVHGHAEALRQVFLNLLENAIKYGGTDNQIIVRLWATMEGLQCSICDRGPGIAPEHLSNVTQRFYRAASSNIPGNGLGLALVTALLDQHHSRLQITSKHSTTVQPGEQTGTCVAFVLLLE